MTFDPEELALLVAIRANPQDDTPRLVYADWLDEHDRPDHAEFIRVQCELGSLPEPDMRAVIAGVPTHADFPTGRCRRCSERPHRCQYHALGSRTRELLAGLFTDIAGYKPSLEGTGDEGTAIVRRGFVEAVVDTFAGWAARADTICAGHPVTAVRLTTWPRIHLDCRTGDVTQTFFRLEGRERWHLSESLPGRAKEGPFLWHRDLLFAEWPTVTEWNLTGTPPEDDNAGMTTTVQFGTTRMSVEEVIARLRASESERESLPRRFLRGIRRLFE